MHDDDRTSETPFPYDPAERPLGVLVGFDGSDQSIQALHYAARAAQRLDCHLTVLTAYTESSMIYANLASLPSPPDEAVRETAAQGVLEGAREELRGYPGEVDFCTAEGDAAGALVHQSSRAQLAVVGARGRGGFVGRLLGSVSSALPAHAHCPTVVVPRQYEIGTGEGAARFAPIADDAPVVAGVDRSERSDVATLLAAQAAHQRGAPLHLVMTMPPPESWGVWYAAMVPEQSVIDQQLEQLTDELETFADRLRGHFPGSVITCEAELADPATQLLDHSAGAQLVVVGTRGHGRIASALLGSVSRSVLQRAECPVMVVPDLDLDRLGNGSPRPR